MTMIFVILSGKFIEIPNTKRLNSFFKHYFGSAKFTAKLKIRFEIKCRNVFV